MKWLRNKLRQWLLSQEEDQPITEIDVVVDGRCQQGSIARQVYGLKLMVRLDNGVFLIGPKQCVDPKRFWRAWGQRVSTDQITWEDGSQFKPGD